MAEKKVRMIIAADVATREWIAEAAEEIGCFDIVCATDDGVECLKAVGRLWPEVIILGVELRRMDGIEVVRRIKSKYQAPKCLVLNQYMTLNEYLAQAGADSCLSVPCTRGALQRHLEGLVLAPVS